MSQKRVLPDPDEPMMQALRLRALAGILGRVFHGEKLRLCQNDVVLNFGSTKGLMSFSVPQRADPYSSSARNFFAFLLFI